MIPKKNSWIAKIGGNEFRVSRLQEVPQNGKVLDNPQYIRDYLREQIPHSPIFSPDVENFMVVYLNTRRRPIGWSVLTNGTIDTLLVDPKNVFKAAIVANAAAIVLAHNHPSGDPTPSEADIKVTRDLVNGGKLLKIEVLDHIVLGQSGINGSEKDFVSLRELGYFY